MSVKLDALITKTEAAVAAEQDPRKRTRLSAQLAQYSATKVAMESDPPNGDEDDEEDDGEESAASKANKVAARKAKMAEAAKHRANASKHRAKAAEYEDAARKCESDDEDAEDAAAAVSRIDRGDAPAERGAAEAAISDHADTANTGRIRALESKLAEQEKAAAIAAALGAGEITPAQAKMLANKRPSWVGEYLETTKGMRVVATDEGHLSVPRDGNRAPPRVDPAALAEIDKHIASLGLKDAGQIEKLRADMITNRAAAMNGQAGRY